MRRFLAAFVPLFGVVSLFSLLATAQVTIDMATGKVTDTRPSAPSASGSQQNKQLTNQNQPSTIAPSQPPPSKPEMPMPTEVGLYYRDGQKWTAVATEAEHEDAGRKVAFSIWVSGMTEGIKKARMFASVAGAHSPCQVSVPVELLFYRPEISESEDYQLISLTTRTDKREFQVWAARAGVGGLDYSAQFDNPNAVQFQCEQVSTRICKIRANLTKGEFAFVYRVFGPRVYTFAVR